MKEASEHEEIAYVVDDVDLVVKSICTLLAARNIESKGFTSAKEFLDQFEVRRRCCIICDYKMPEMDGLTVQQELHAQGHEPSIIFLSGAADVAMAVQALNQGAVTVIEKPFRSEKLLLEVDRAFIKSEEDWERKEALQRFEAVTDSELLVLKYLVAGKINKQIARLIDQSERTVERRKNSILEKTKSSSIFEAADLARKAKIDLSLPDEL